MTNDRIDGGAAQDGHEQIASKPHALNHGARDDCRGRSAKGQVKENECPPLGVGFAVEEKLRVAKYAEG